MPLVLKSKKVLIIYEMVLKNTIIVQKFVHQMEQEFTKFCLKSKNTLLYFGAI